MSPVEHHIDSFSPTPDEGVGRPSTNRYLIREWSLPAKRSRPKVGTYVVEHIPDLNYESTRSEDMSSDDDDQSSCTDRDTNHPFHGDHPDFEEDSIAIAPGFTTQRLTVINRSSKPVSDHVSANGAGDAVLKCPAPSRQHKPSRSDMYTHGKAHADELFRLGHFICEFGCPLGFVDECDHTYHYRDGVCVIPANKADEFLKLGHF